MFIVNNMATRSGKTYQEPKRSKTRHTIRGTNTTLNGKYADNDLEVPSISRDSRSRSSIKNSTFDKSDLSIKKDSLENSTESNWIISDLSSKNERPLSEINTYANGSIPFVTESMKKSDTTKKLKKRKPRDTHNTFDKADKIVDTTYDTDTAKYIEITDAMQGNCNNSDINSETSVETRNNPDNTENDLNSPNIGKSVIKKKKVKASRKKKLKRKRKENIEETSLNNVKTINTTFNKDVEVKDRAYLGDNSDLNISNTNIQSHLKLDSSNVSYKSSGNRKSNIKDTTFEKQDKAIDTTYEKDVDIDRTFDKDLDCDTTDKTSGNIKQNKSIVSISFSNNDNINDTLTKEESTSCDILQKGAKVKETNIAEVSFNKINSAIRNLSQEKEKDISSSPANKRMSLRRQTMDMNLLTSFATFKKGAIIRKSSITDESIPNISQEKNKSILLSPANKRMSLRKQTMYLDHKPTEKLNMTFEKTCNEETEKKPLRSYKVLDIEKLNTTFDKEQNAPNMRNSKSSLISSDNSSEYRVSITSDDSMENIINATPVLIESSMDETQVKESPQVLPNTQTPLKREGTFTKDAPEVVSPQTPSKGESVIPTAGCTPYHVSKSSQKKRELNVTRSIEKKLSIDPGQRMTRVMFCSPIDLPVTETQDKKKIIKSNLKGSNKSFVFDENTSLSRPARKRSYTQNDADDCRAKRSRLTEDVKLSRPRTASVTTKLGDTTPKKANVLLKAKSETKSVRTRLPNFAALHQKQFAKMESLDQCQERKARRAREMLTPTASTNVLYRNSPKITINSPKPATKELVKPKDKTDTPTKKLPTLQSLRPGFTRFGFKLNLDINPFSIQAKTDKPKETPSVVPKSGPLPSVTGATSSRRAAAQQTVMREKSFLEKRKASRSENRTIIKGVRTNRRFELQMKFRNIE